MMYFLCFVVGVIVGALLLAARLRQQFPKMADEMMRMAIPSSAADPASSMPSGLIPVAHVEALVAEILQQIKSKVDVDRNQVRLAQLRELLPEDSAA